MNANLKGNQLANGKGYFEIIQNKSNINNNPQNNHPDIHHNKIINLEPWGQWINIINSTEYSTTQNNINNNSNSNNNSNNNSNSNSNNNSNSTQSNARLIRTSDNRTLLVLPNINTLHDENTIKSETNNKDSNPNSPQRIYFEWSLRGKIDIQDRLQFDLTFPRSVGVEFNIELPADKILTCSSGIVLENKSNMQNPNSRNWKILIGAKNSATIIIANSNTPQVKKTNTGYRQSILYNISTSGLEVTTTLLFDQNDPEIDSFEIELDSPLVPVAVHSGDITIHSSFIEQIENNNSTLLRVDLSEVEAARRHEVMLVALAPIITGNSRSDIIAEDNIWKLPRIRAVSKNLFWKETRCSIIVQRPLQTRNLSFQNSVQVRPIAETGRTPHDTFELKYFDSSAQAGINIYQAESRISVDSFVQIHINDDTISGNMNAVIQATEGQCFTFTIPISPNWVINSVKGMSGDEITSWDVIPAKDLKIEPNHNFRNNNNIDSYLSLQLKKPLGTGELLRIQIIGRFLTDLQREFKLTEFLPLSLLLQKNESHFIAIQTELPSRLQYRLQNSALFEVRDLTSPKLQRLFLEQPEGILLPLDMRTQEVAFKTSRARPDYTAAITNKINIGEFNSTMTFKFNIKPRETTIERIYIYFVKTKNINDTNNPNDTKISPQNQIDNKRQWHWEFSNSTTRSDLYRTENSQIAQTRLISGHELDDLTASIADQNPPDNFKKGELWEIRLATPQNYPFEIIANTQITTDNEIVIPFAAVPSASAQQGEIYIESDGQFPYSILSKKLKSIPIDIFNRQSNQNIRAAFKFDPIDEIKHTNELTLKLQRIDKTSIPPQAWIWLMKLESQYEIDGIVRNCVNCHIENRGKESLLVTLPDEIKIEDVQVIWIDNQRTTWHSNSPQTLTVAIPPSVRYLTVSIEYSYKNNNSQIVTEIAPKYPQTDIPVLTKNCITWINRDYKIFNSSNKLNVSALFRADILEYAANLFNHDNKQHKAKLALQSLIELISQTKKEHSELTWQMLAENEKIFNELLLQNIRTFLNDKSYDAAAARFYIDVTGFSRSRITPKSAVMPKIFLNGNNVCENKTLFISIKTAKNGQDEFSFYFMPFLTAGVFQHFNGKQIGENTWLADDDAVAKFILNSVNIDNNKESVGKTYESIPSTTIDKPRMLNITDWIRAVQKTENILWSDTNPSFRQGNISPDWNAYSISGSDNTAYFIARISLLKSYYLAAMLVMIVLACKRPITQPVLLIIIMIVSQTAYYFLPPAYAALSEGIFTGAAISFIFAIIRFCLFDKNKIATQEKQSKSEIQLPTNQQEGIKTIN
jgi:hypothetical protein